MGEPIKRDQQINVRFTENGVAHIDKVRGAWSRSEYIRRATALAVKQGKTGPQSGDEW